MNLTKRTILPFLILTVGLALTSCGGNGAKTNAVEADETGKLYTPISVYFNPLKASNYDFYSSYLPYFVNYPDDWTKMGLHERPSYVRHSSLDRWSESTVSWTYYFGQLGNITSIVNSVLGRDEFIYDDDLRLQDIKRMQHVSNWDKRDDQFEYADSLLVRRNVSPSHSTSHTFSYYPDGVLKEIAPDKGIYYDDKMKLGKLEFNAKGQLVRTESASTYNPFILPEFGSEGGKSPNICTFKYNDRGLCVEKNEVITFTYYDHDVDTLRCVNRYEYNDKGDLKTWSYNGACRENVNGNTWRFVDRAFKIDFDYEYDEKGKNWITQTITLPDCYKDVEALGIFYEKNVNGYYRADQGVTALPAGQKAKVTITREIGPYYETDVEELKAMMKQAKAEREVAHQEELDRTRRLVKFSAAQAMGLYGNVESLNNVKTESKQGYMYFFDEIGRITKVKSSLGTVHQYEYDDRSPLRYKDGEKSDFYNLEFTENQRIVSFPGNDYATQIFTFDTEGRLEKHTFYTMFHNGKYIVEEEEISYDDNEKVPVKMVLTTYYPEGNRYMTYVYSEIETDDYGNWTKRRVDRYVREEKDRLDENGEDDGNGKWRENYMESRKLTYY